MIRSVFQAHVFIFMATCFASMNYSIAKIVMPSEISPYSIVLSRILLSTVFFFILDYLLYKEHHYRLSLKDKGRLLLCGLMGVALNQLTFYKGLSLSTPIHTALIIATIPVFVLIFTALFLRQLPTWKQVLGVLISASGAYYLILYTVNPSQSQYLEGDFLILINCVSYAVYLVAVKPLLTRYHPLFVTKWMFAIAAVIVLPYTYGEVLKTQWSHVSTQGWLSYAYIILFATLFNYYYTTATLQWLSPVTTGAYGYLQPFLATLFAVFIGLDALSTEKVLAGLIIISGILLTSRLFNRIPLEFPKDK